MSTTFRATDQSRNPSMNNWNRPNLSYQRSQHIFKKYILKYNNNKIKAIQIKLLITLIMTISTEYNYSRSENQQESPTGFQNENVSNTF